MTTQTGTVKWFDDGKGFGFITPDGGGKDLFAHFSEIQSTGGFRSLAENQKVQFEVKQGRISGPFFRWCTRQGALTWRWKSSTDPARGTVS